MICLRCKSAKVENPEKDFFCKSCVDEMNKETREQHAEQSRRFGGKCQCEICKEKAAA